MGGVNLEQNYGYTMWASNKAQEVADDGKITTAELKDIAKTVGNKDGQISEAELVLAGFSKQDAHALFEQIKKTGWNEIGVNFEKSLLQRGVAAAGSAANAVANTATQAYHATAKAVVATGQVVQQAAAKVVDTAKKAVVATGQVVHQAATKVVDTAKKVVVATGQVVQKAATKVVDTAKTVAHHTAEFGKGVGHGIVHAAQHLGHGVVEFAKEHPVITGAIVVGAAALITVASGGVAGPVAAGFAASALHGLAVGGMVVGGAITGVKVVQSGVQLAKGNYEKAGEKFGEGLFEAAVTFAPGAGVKSIEKLAHTTSHAAHALKASADVVEDMEKAGEVLANAASLANKAQTIHTVEKVVHGAHELFEAHEIASVKAPEAFHLASSMVGDGHEGTVEEGQMAGKETRKVEHH